MMASNWAKRISQSVFMLAACCLLLAMFMAGLTLFLGFVTQGAYLPIWLGYGTFCSIAMIAMCFPVGIAFAALGAWLDQ